MSSRLVYSTETGRICPDCSYPVADCHCKQETVPAPGSTVTVRRETGGRKGREVTTVRGTPLARVELAVLARELRRLCGSGGTVADGVIEIQGNHVDGVAAELEKRGFKVKRG
ncbi:translation initiation factor Sui1 [Paludibacterium yongneupense]|uniref:translation initiation factor Sui1 n=1 Tax=Paludibacterium yongneupense TaxID=400061 RepID=UPI0003F4DC06|nr:translation initiation factor Sui1 [Paludibacterium yongneupense]